MYQPNIIKKTYHNARRIVAKNWFKIVHPYNIGITGSMGKTTTSNILATLFKDAVVTDVNLDTIYNIPITVLRLKKDTKTAILEYGIDQVGEMDKHLEIAKPNAVIITGITAVHTDAEHLGSLENLIKEKRKLIECLTENDIAILNYDDENVRAMAGFTKAKVIFYGSNNEKCAVSYTKADIKLSVAGTSFKISDNEAGQIIEFQTKLLGTQFIYNFMSAYIVYKNYHEKQGVEMAEIMRSFQEQVKEIPVLKGRMSLDKVADYFVLNDSLRSNPLSVVNGLDTFELLEIEVGQRKIAILGEMGELGESEEAEHKKIGQLIVEMKGLDLFIGIGPLQKLAIDEAVNNGLPKEKTYYAQNPLEVGQFLKKYLKSGDVIYLKGSLLRHMERILMLINNESVACSAVSCPFYNPCKVCKYRDGGCKD